MPYHVFLIACHQEVNYFPFSSLFCFLKYIALNAVLGSPGCTHFSRSQQAVWAEKVKPESHNSYVMGTEDVERHVILSESVALTT